MQLHQLRCINKQDFSWTKREILAHTENEATLQARLTEARIGQVSCHYLKRDHVIKMSHSSQFNANNLIDCVSPSCDNGKVTSDYIFLDKER